MNLKELSKKDKYWRKVAYNICKDSMLADDIVQDMYLKLYDKNNKINDFYVILTIRSLFIDYCRNNKTISLDRLFYLEDNVNTFEPDDYEIDILESFESLPFHQREFIEESYNKSIREIAKDLNIDYGFVFREIKKAKKKIL